MPVEPPTWKICTSKKKQFEEVVWSIKRSNITLNMAPVFGKSVSRPLRRHNKPPWLTKAFKTLTQDGPKSTSENQPNHHWDEVPVIYSKLFFEKKDWTFKLSKNWWKFIDVTFTRMKIVWNTVECWFSFHPGCVSSWQLSSIHNSLRHSHILFFWWLIRILAMVCCNPYISR